MIVSWQESDEKPRPCIEKPDITLLTKVHIVKATVFPVATYGCDNWTIKKAECQRIDAFKLWCWRRLLKVRWTAQRSNMSILREINSEYSLEGLILKLKFQYFGHLMWTADSLESPWCWERMRAEGKLVEVMEFQLSCFKSWEMIPWKCCTQYASKFGKLSSSHRTGKGQFSFQCQRKAMPKNAQTTTQLHSSHTLVQ